MRPCPLARLSNPVRRTAAFTLVELLVVIGVIALLISILMPTLSRAQESAKAVTCQSNMRQIAVAFLNYSQANRNYYMLPSFTPLVSPAGFKSDGRFNYSWGWANGNLLAGGSAYLPASEGLLWPYIKSEAVMSCPSAKGIIPSALPEPAPHMAYARNTRTGANATKISRLTQIRRPAETFILYDSAIVSVVTGSLQGQVTGNFPSSGLPSFHGRHIKRGSVAWYDGHVTLEEPYISLVNLATGYGSYTLYFQKSNLGFLSPVPKGTPQASFKTDPMADYYYWMNKEQKF